MTSQKNPGAAATASSALLAYRCAASDMLHAARLFIGASARLAEGARALDPDGTREEDPAVLALADSVAELFAMAAATSPGVRLLFIEALERAAAIATAASESSACTQ